jgi:hypothetical protein
VGEGGSGLRAGGGRPVVEHPPEFSGVVRRVIPDLAIHPLRVLEHPGPGQVPAVDDDDGRQERAAVRGLLVGDLVEG